MFNYDNIICINCGQNPCSRQGWVQLHIMDPITITITLKCFLSITITITPKIFRANYNYNYNFSKSITITIILVSVYTGIYHNAAMCFWSHNKIFFSK